MAEDKDSPLDAGVTGHLPPSENFELSDSLVTPEPDLDDSESKEDDFLDEEEWERLFDDVDDDADEDLDAISDESEQGSVGLLFFCCVLAAVLVGLVLFEVSQIGTTILR